MNTFKPQVNQQRTYLQSLFTWHIYNCTIWSHNPSNRRQKKLKKYNWGHLSYSANEYIHKVHSSFSICCVSNLREVLLLLTGLKWYARTNRVPEESIGLWKLPFRLVSPFSLSHFLGFLENFEVQPQQYRNVIQRHVLSRWDGHFSHLIWLHLDESDLTLNDFDMRYHRALFMIRLQ